MSAIIISIFEYFCTVGPFFRSFEAMVLEDESYQKLYAAKGSCAVARDGLCTQIDAQRAQPVSLLEYHGQRRLMSSAPWNNDSAAKTDGLSYSRKVLRTFRNNHIFEHISPARSDTYFEKHLKINGIYVHKLLLNAILCQIRHQGIHLRAASSITAASFLL